MNLNSLNFLFRYYFHSTKLKASVNGKFLDYEVTETLCDEYDILQ